MFAYEFFGGTGVLFWWHSLRFQVWWSWHSVGRPAARIVQRWQVPRYGRELGVWLIARSLPRLHLRMVIVVLFLAACYGSGRYISEQVLVGLPPVQELMTRQPIVSTKIYDRRGTLLFTIFKDENRTIVPLSEVSPTMIQATLAIEDADFYQHHGVSWKGLMRALVNNIRGEHLQGGSTITQQLVKNVLLSRERTWQRKAKEMILATQAERHFSKDAILERYLNDVNYGGSLYGVEEASRWYFDSSAHDLTLAESAFLAGLPQAPGTYSPFGPSPDKAYVRQKEVLRRMWEDGYITTEMMEQAAQETLVFRPSTHDIVAPHFVMYVRQLLEEKFGEDMVTQGGLEVYTTLDASLQASAEAAVRDELARLGRLDVTNGSALVTQPSTGEVLAMVGSRDYFDREHDGEVNVTLRPRQPGSSIKPLTYAVAFEHGYTSSTQIDDTPVVYTAPGAPSYSPKNYDGQFHGRVTLRQALGSSYNIPAVRLIVDLGVKAVVEKGRRMGITTWNDASRFGPALTLGAGEVTMYDMAKLYGTFANGGITVPLDPLLRVTTYDGRELYKHPCPESLVPCRGERTVTAHASYQVTSILSDNQARTPAFGPRSALFFPNQEVAVKTGTTNDRRDNWTIGYTTDRVVLSWVGNNDNRPMSAVASGVTGASPIFHTIMQQQLTNRLHTFVFPSELERVKICRQTNTLPCGECPQVVEEVFLRGTAPGKSCTAEMFAQTGEDARTASER